MLSEILSEVAEVNSTTDIEWAPVSVVIPCYRCADTIGRAVDSVFRQSMRPKELILVDDKGGDDTVSKLYEIQSSYPTGWVHVVEQSKNGGAGTARNAGWAKASQPYLAFLDADDCWHLRKIELQYRWMRAHCDVIMTGHGVGVIDDGRCAVETQRAGVAFNPVQVSIFKLLLSNRFATSSVMLKTSVQFRFAEGKRYSEDYLLWLMLCASGKCCVSSPKLTFYFKDLFGAGGLSSNLWKMTRGELETFRLFKNYQGLSSLFFYPLCFYSLLKYFRRVLLSTLRLR